MNMTLKQRYRTEIIPKLKTELGCSNVHQVPSLVKITVNVGASKAVKEPKMIEVMEETLRRITGQKPVRTKARLSIAGFKIRKGMVVGLVVTLRGKRMWDFLEKLVAVTFPRVRDFRGVPLSSVDASGNFSCGFREHMAFPEVRSDEIEAVHGLQVTVTTNAKKRERGLALFRALGVPFQHE